jgi:tetratricopeptide (TPR) repeat protein/predicted Ser/Thr protein kinase
MPMTPVEWSAVKEILNSALECEPAARPAYLDQACGGDGELRRQVEALIEADGQTWTLMEAPALVSSSLAATTRLPASGERIGAYEILQEIGHGGMGIVYLARRADDQFDKKVAIKLARLGMDESLERRFRAERQIIASLDHPNIARLLDGGSAAGGRLYLVMEYVEGRPLGQWCDARELSTRDRLEIFLEVCTAVQYAHQHLVVHRDLKPANILVTEQGNVKLLDFGIAKLIAPDSGEAVEQTGTLFRLLTPDYASPEQVRGGPISTASDVYALGIVLYELLTGGKPYRVADTSPAEMQWIICEREPARPSAVAKPPASKALAGDLDTIILKALRKEPGRRYVSAEAFAQDIRRHLGGLPVEARADAFGYRAGKFVRRHRASVAAAALVVAALAAGLIMTLREARRARAAEARAEQRFNDVRKLANSYLFELHDAIRDLPGSTPARELLVKRALEYLDSLSREKGSDPGLRRELAQAYQRVGDVLGRAGFANLGDSAGALASYNKALALRRELVAADPGNQSLLLELATSFDRVGELSKALEIRERLARESPGDQAVQVALEISYHNLARDFAAHNEFEQALAYRQKQLAMAEALWKAVPGNPAYARDLAIAFKYVAGSLEGKRPAEALEYYRKAAVIDESRAAAGPPGGPARLDLSFDYAGIGDCQAALGDLAGGLANHRKALAIREEVAAADPKNVFPRHSLARAHGRIAWILGKTANLEGAFESYRKSLEIRQGLASRDPSNAEYAFYVAETLGNMGRLHAEAAAAPTLPKAARTGHWTEAKQSYQKSRQILLDLQRAGKLKDKIDGEPEKLAAEIARCDTGLAARGR